MTTSEGIWKAPTRDELVAALDRLLETPRAESGHGGGWAVLPEGRLSEVNDFFRMVGRAVAEPDADGDPVIQWTLVDCRLGRAPASWIVAPHMADTPETLRETLRAASSLAAASMAVLASVESDAGRMLASMAATKDGGKE